MSAGNPLIQPSGLRGLGRGGKTYHLCHKEQKKEEPNPKAEQLSAMPLRHQSPVKEVIRKLKASYCETGLRGNEPWLFRMGGAVKEKRSGFQGLKSRACPSGNHGGGRWLGRLLCEPLNVILGNSFTTLAPALSWLLCPGGARGCLVTLGWPRYPRQRKTQERAAEWHPVLPTVCPWTAASL